MRAYQMGEEGRSCRITVTMSCRLCFSSGLTAYVLVMEGVCGSL